MIPFTDSNLITELKQMDADTGQENLIDYNLLTPLVV